MELYYFLREFELANIQIVFVTFTILFLHFVNKAYKRGDLYYAIYEIGLATFFLCNALNFIFRFIDFYYPSFIYFELLIYSRISIMIGVTVLLASLELSKMLETKGFITLSFATVTIISNLIAARSTIVMIISSFIHIIIPIIYFYFAIKEKGIIKYQIFFNGLGILTVLIGATIRPSDLYPQFPNIIRFFENTFYIPFEIFPYALIYLGLLLMMVFEVNFMAKSQWLEKIRSLYLINWSKNIIIQKCFDEEQKAPKYLPENSEEFTNLLDNIIKSKKKGKLKIDDKKILVEYGEQLIGIIIADERSKTISKKLKEFITDVEQLFRDVLPKWNETNLKIFKPAYILLNRHFSKPV